MIATSASTFDSRMRRFTSSPVPTGTVDLATTTVKPQVGRYFLFPAQRSKHNSRRHDHRLAVKACRQQ